MLVRAGPWEVGDGLVAELSMVVQLLRQSVASAWPHVFLPMLFAFQLTSFNIWNLLSQIDHLFSRLNSVRVDPETKGANRGNLAHESTGMYSAEFIILINGEEVSLVFLEDFLRKRRVFGLGIYFPSGVWFSFCFFKPVYCSNCRTGLERTSAAC